MRSDLDFTLLHAQQYCWLRDRHPMRRIKAICPDASKDARETRISPWECGLGDPARSVLGRWTGLILRSDISTQIQAAITSTSSRTIVLQGRGLACR